MLIIHWKKSDKDHFVLEVRVGDSQEDSKLRGYLTLMPDEWEDLKHVLEVGGIPALLVAGTVNPKNKGIHPELVSSRDRFKR